jgi:hypothetical protein
LNPISGNWSLDHGHLVSSGGGREMIALPGEMPAEYDLTVDFTRLTGDDDINLVFQANGSSFMLDMGGWHNTVFGVDMVDGKRAVDVVDSLRGENLLPLQQKNTIVVHVRRSAFSVDLNGKSVYRINSNYKNFSLNGDWSAAARSSLGIATQNTSVSFDTIRVSPASR